MFESIDLKSVSMFSFEFTSPQHLDMLSLREKRHSIVCHFSRMYIHLFSFFFIRSFVVDKTYPRIKITQAYHSNHLIDYLVSFVSLHIVCIWIGFQFCSFSLSRSPPPPVRLFVFNECIYKKRNWWLAFLFVHENQSSKDYLLCNCPILFFGPKKEKN